MKKSKQYTKNYSNLSKNEASLLSLVEKYSLSAFEVRELRRLSDWSKNRLHNTLFSLEKKHVLTRIKRGVYTLTSKVHENIFEIATKVVVPSYVSFWAALSYYGFTEQQIRTVQLVSTRQMKELHFNSYFIQTVTFQPREFFGYKKINGFVVAEKEKVLIDSLFQLEKCGGLDEYVKCLKNAWKTLDKKRFIRYLKRFGNKSLISRIGYLTEQLKLGYMSSLEKHRSLSPIKLNPKGERSGKYNKKWNVLVNENIHVENII